jgi:WD40 repeat protein
MVYSPDGKYLLTLGGWVNNTEVDWRRIVNENTVRLWRTEDGSLVFDTGKANGAITRFGFSHSAKFCFATDQSRVRVWQVEAGMLFSEKPLDDLRGRVSIRAGLATNEPGFVSTGRLAVYFLDSGEFEVIGEMGKSFAEVSSATLVDSIMPFETSPDGKRVLLSYPSNLSILFDVVSGLRTLQRYAEGGFGTTPNAS